MQQLHFTAMNISIAQTKISWGPIMICLTKATNHDVMNKSRLL